MLKPVSKPSADAWSIFSDIYAAMLCDNQQPLKGYVLEGVRPCHCPLRDWHGAESTAASSLLYRA